MRLLDDKGGMRTYFDYDHAAQETRIVRVQDVEPILERNKSLANDSDYSRQGIREDWWHYATIPNVVLEMWYAQGLVKSPTLTDPEDAGRVQKLLRDPQWRYLKTVSGKTG